MKVYFVRHGESEANIMESHQDATPKLTEKGREQAKFIAHRVSELLIDHIFSSNMIRAKETAEIINSVIKKPIEFSDLFGEIRNPSEVNGLKFTDPEAVKIKGLQRENFGKLGWRYSDEENFEDRFERITSILNHLIQSKKENILVVTHGGILKYIICKMMFGEDINPEIGRKFSTFMYPSNTGITICEYIDNKWWMITYNDIAHLAE